MADSLPPSSSSLPGTSCTSVQRPLKRRFTSSDLDFFTPAAVSFKPRPYTPSNAALNSLAKTNASFRAHARALEPHVLPPAGMDPQPSDPNVVFIHPPFTSFPTSDIHPEGLSYQLMADNPEWFLDANDFLSQNNTNLNAMPYPSFLEPPRGWCPAKKKDLKDRGSEGWPEGEEPRLRCTFCRRTYAGVNAKSMWRRHVFEKHKIAMSNRRDGHDRPRGRGSNKENRQAVPKQSDDAHDSLVHMNVTAQAEPQNISHKSKFRTLIPETKQRLSKSDLLFAHATPTKSSTSNDGRFEPHSPISPPLTPHASSSSADHSENPQEQLHVTSEPPAPSFPIIPESPYDPLQTPSFRHSPPRLPSDQPWRFPSPSHPLHSRTRNLSLSMLIRDLNSPISKRSPGVRGSISESPAPSPCASVSTSRRRDLADFNTPERVAKYPKPSPRILSSRSRAFLPLGDKGRYQIEESPLRKDFRPGSAGGEKLRSGLIDDWFSDAPLPSSVSHDILTNNDPFVSMYSWETVPDGGNEARKPNESDVPSPDNESPVLRHACLPPGTGLGIGLLDPFSLSDTDDFLPADSDGDFDGMMTGPLVTQSDSRDGADVPAVLTSSSKDTAGALPPKKRRRMSE